jgi:hypothetical protein
MQPTTAKVANSVHSQMTTKLSLGTREGLAAGHQAVIAITRWLCHTLASSKPHTHSAGCLVCKSEALVLIYNPCMLFWYRVKYVKVKDRSAESRATHCTQAAS